MCMKEGGNNGEGRKGVKDEERKVEGRREERRERGKGREGKKGKRLEKLKKKEEMKGSRKREEGR